ncbi:hypothetical protein X975_09225, partial [Stegodyphus mimosarum]
MLYLIIFIATEGVLSVAGDSSDDLCPAWGSMACANDLKGDLLYLDENTPLEENKEIFERKCENTMPYIKCVLDFGARHCPNISENIHYEGFKYEYATYSRICDKNEEINKWYIENAKCLNIQMVQIYQKCEKTPKIRGLRELTKEICEIDKRRVECNFEEIGKKCGKDAFLLAKEIMSSYTKVIEKSCSKFEF